MLNPFTILIALDFSLNQTLEVSCAVEVSYAVEVNYAVEVSYGSPHTAFRHKHT